jgi:hypothetical protein
VPASTRGAKMPAAASRGEQPAGLPQRITYVATLTSIADEIPRLRFNILCVAHLVPLYTEHVMFAQPKATVFGIGSRLSFIVQPSCFNAKSDNRNECLPSRILPFAPSVCGVERAHEPCYSRRCCCKSCRPVDVHMLARWLGERGAVVYGTPTQVSVDLSHRSAGALQRGT